MSSWIALTRRINFTAGQRVLVLGAVGNAGRMAIQIAKYRARSSSSSTSASPASCPRPRSRSPADVASHLRSRIAAQPQPRRSLSITCPRPATAHEKGAGWVAGRQPRRGRSGASDFPQRVPGPDPRRARAVMVGTPWCSGSRCDAGAALATVIGRPSALVVSRGHWAEMPGKAGRRLLVPSARRPATARSSPSTRCWKAVPLCGSPCPGALPRRCCCPLCCSPAAAPMPSLLPHHRRCPLDRSR